MTENTYGKELIEKHVLIDNKGGAIFLLILNQFLLKTKMVALALKQKVW